MRKSIVMFAHMMEDRLKEFDDTKTMDGWTTQLCLNGAISNINELQDALDMEDVAKYTECAVDAANYLMMVVGLDPTVPEKK